MGTSPAIACGLAPEELPARLSQTRRLGTSLRDVHADGSHASLRFDGPGTRAEVERFVSAESTCCPFFKFEIRPEGTATILSIETPDEGAPLLRGLVAGFVSAWELPS